MKIDLMQHSGSPSLLLIAIPPLAAGLLILGLADVGRSLWLVQLLSIVVAGIIALAGMGSSRFGTARSGCVAILLLTLAGLAAPLLRQLPGPDRWIALGPLNLYLAPLLLPVFLAASWACLRTEGSARWFAYAALAVAGIVLAVQPDASQVLAVLAGTAALLWASGARVLPAILTLAVLALATVWAFMQPDPLQPVAYVEGVFALALDHSVLAGVAVLAGALALVGGLILQASHGARWLSGAAAYYAVLYGCSVAGLTPAPLIGYGAGPVLGFGLLAALSLRLAARTA